MTFFREMAADFRFSVGAWRVLVGEVLAAAATDIPLIETPLESLAAILQQELAEERSCFSPIQRAVLGSRDLTLGGFVFRPDHAGLNHREDVQFLSGWLQTVDPERWSSDNSTEGNDDVAFAREWFPDLVRLYEQAAKEDSVIVCEEIA